MRRSFEVRTWVMLLALFGVAVVTPADDDLRSIVIVVIAAVAMGLAYACGRIEGSDRATSQSEVHGATADDQPDSLGPGHLAEQEVRE